MAAMAGKEARVVQAAFVQFVGRCVGGDDQGGVGGEYVFECTRQYHCTGDIFDIELVDNQAVFHARPVRQRLCAMDLARQRSAVADR